LPKLLINAGLIIYQISTGYLNGRSFASLKISGKPIPATGYLYNQKHQLSPLIRVYVF